MRVAWNLLLREIAPCIGAMCWAMAGHGNRGSLHENFVAEAEQGGWGGVELGWWDNRGGIPWYTVEDPILF